MSEALYRVEAICSNCGHFLMGSNERPHLTLEELNSRWLSMVTSAPLNAPRCPGCGYSTDRDYNAHFDFLIDDGTIKVPSREFFHPEADEPGIPVDLGNSDGDDDPVPA